MTPFSAAISILRALRPDFSVTVVPGYRQLDDFKAEILLPLQKIEPLLISDVRRTDGHQINL